MGKNAWIAQGFKVSCTQKRNLYTLTKNSNDPKAKPHYIMYCRILRLHPTEQVPSTLMKMGKLKDKKKQWQMPSVTFF